MTQLRISLFGGVEVAHDHTPPNVKITRIIQNLLVYLVVTRHSTRPREVLAGLFWGEQSESHAKHCLNTALWRLRKILEPTGIERGAYLITTAAGEVGFNGDADIWFDVAQFDDNVKNLINKPIVHVQSEDVSKLENAVSLYSDDYLEGIYDDWAIKERLRIRSLFLSSLERLMRYYKECNNYDKSIHYANCLLESDPLREEIHRELIRLYLENGQRTKAIQQYNNCRDIISRELCVPPMKETQNLFEVIGRGHDLAEETTLESNANGGAQLLQMFNDSLLRFNEAHAELKHTIQLIERLVGKI